MFRNHKILAIAALAVIGLASTSMFGVAHAGWVDGWGNYHPTCHRVIEGYDYFGRAIFGVECD